MNAPLLRRPVYLMSSLLGNRGSLAPLFIAGAILGSLAGKVPEVEFALFFPVPGYFLYMLVRIFRFVRYPREESWAFILGVSYVKRKSIAVSFVKNMSGDCILFIVTTLLFFTMTNLSSLQSKATSAPILSTILFVVFQIPLLYGVLRLGIATGFFGPSHHDARPFFLMSLGSKKLWQNLSALRLVVALRIGLLFLAPVTFHMSRLCLYILRRDMFGLVLATGLTFPIVILLCIMLGSSNYAAIGIVCAAGALVLAIRLTAIIHEAHKTLHECEYYRATDVGLAKAQNILARFCMLPFLIAYPILYISIRHDSLFTTLVNCGTFFVAFVVMYLFIIRLWQQRGWDGIVAANFGTMLLCLLVGLSIPLYGSAIILVSGISIFFIMRPFRFR